MSPKNNDGDGLKVSVGVEINVNLPHKGDFQCWNIIVV